MAFGTLTAGEARSVAERVAQRLASDERVRLVFLYGSAADPERREVRDVDLAIACSTRLSFADLMCLRADAIAVAGAPVDLIALDDAGVVLAWEVAEGGQCLFSRGPDDEVEFVTRARARYWDFKPLLEAQWRLAGERLEARRRAAES